MEKLAKEKMMVEKRLLLGKQNTRSLFLSNKMAADNSRGMAKSFITTGQTGR